jgi:hypothetical protein
LGICRGNSAGDVRSGKCSRGDVSEEVRRREEKEKKEREKEAGLTFEI